MQLTLRFVVLIVALLAAVASSALSGTTALTRLDAALTRIVDDDMERLLAITHSRRLFRSMVVLERDYILSRDELERDQFDKKMSTLGSDLSEQLAKYKRSMPPADAESLRAIEGARERWIALDREVRAKAHGDPDAALLLSKQHTKDPVSWEKSIGELVKQSESRLGAQVAQTHRVYLDARSHLTGVSALAALLAAVFGYFIFHGIRRNMAEVVRLNTNLEGQVKERTKTLEQREHSLRLILDSTGDGLFEVDRKGQLTGACSAAAVRWFGRPQPNATLSGYLFPDDADQAARFATAFDQLAEDVMPWELCADQMPRHLRRATSTFELEFKRVMEGDEFVKVLVVARDVTEALQAERAQQSAREQQSLIGKLLQDKAGFAQFVKDCERLLSSLSTEHDLSVAKRDLHTLKGNVAIFGLSSVAEFCHSVEDRMAASGGLPTAIDVADLSALWRMRMQSIEAFLSEFGDARLEVDRHDHQRLLESLLSRQDYPEIIGMVELWSWARTSERLSRFRAHAEHLANRLGKTVRVEIEHDELRAPNDYLERFWPTLIHVVRNAVDHGAEAAEARVARGKAPETEIVLVTRQTDDRFVIEVRDDGPGIDRAALLRSAREKGFALADGISLHDLVFMDGISSREEVSETSGRGVGLGAVRQACAAEGGSVEVLSEPGGGTTFRFSFRQPVIKIGALVERVQRRWSFRPTVSAPPPITAPPPVGPSLPANSNAPASRSRTG